MTVLAPPLDTISQEAQPYPAFHLYPGLTGLALFAAAFEGRNDSVHFARNDMIGTCVDTDGDSLYAMSVLYPDDWSFVVSDAWVFAVAAAGRGDSWDVVSADTFTGDAMERSLASLDLWCSIANHVVTVTTVGQTAYTVPDGWTASIFERTPRASWLVLQR